MLACARIGLFIGEVEELEGGRAGVLFGLLFLLHYGTYSLFRSPKTDTPYKKEESDMEVAEGERAVFYGHSGILYIKSQI